jgi:gliding motility-associated-like protein
MDSVVFGGSGICKLPDGGFVVGGLTGQVVKLDASGNVVWAMQILPNAYMVFGITAGAGGSIYILSIAEDSIGVNGWQLVIKLNSNGEKQWDKKLGSVGFDLDGILADSDGGVLVTSQTDAFDQEFRYSKLSPEGEMVWAKALVLDAPSWVSHRPAIAELAGGGYLFGGSFWNTASSGILIKTTDNGQPIWGKSFSKFNIRDAAEFSNGQLLISGISNDASKIVFTKLTAGGDVIWAKAIANEGISVSRNVTVTSTNDIIIRTGVGSKLTGILKLDENGALQWGRGYPAGNILWGLPQATQDGGFAFLIPSYSVDTASQAGLLKVNSEGLLPGCESIDLCVDIEDFFTETSPLSWVEKNVNYDTAFESSLVPINVLSEDYCAPLEIPSPTFQLPDSICAGDRIAPDSLAQANAGSWWWTFEGASPDTSSQQNPGEVLFPEPGTFEIKQVITFGGCPDSFSTTLTVLPSPQVDLGADTLLCDAASYLLDGTSPGATSYFWENGSTKPMRLIEANGVYSLLVSNEYCEKEASVEVRFFNETYPGASLDLGPDSTWCDNFTLTLDASLPGAGSYLWEDGDTAALRIISQSGTYAVTAFLENCPLTDEAEITITHCEGKVYVPNAFSPNGDSVNDLFRPFGQDVVFKNMKIFDRWGGILYNSDQPDPGWDGTRKGKPAIEGVYVYLLEYEDLLTGQTELISGDVLLVR